MARTSSIGNDTLSMALIGYEQKKQEIEERMREIRAQLRGKSAPSAAGGEAKPAGVKRVLSPAARRRIAMAQKKRWAEHRKRAAAAAKQSKSE